MPNLTPYGGVNEIGGNKILLEDRGTKLFLDFGISFSSLRKYFSGHLVPRAINGIGDYLEFDLLPGLRGLYSKTALKNSDLSYKGPEFHGILLSHAHIDHSGYLPFIDERIPIFCSEATRLVLDAIREQGGLDLGRQKLVTFRERVRVGSLEIETFPVDHSIPGACGFIIKTSKGPIVYTGDIRMHGPKAQATRTFVRRAKESRPTVMICEGTRISGDEEPLTEEVVKNASREIVVHADQLVIAAFYSKDLDRFRTFHSIAKETRRKLVISTKKAHYLTKLRRLPSLLVPNISTDPNMLVYKRRRKSGRLAASDYYPWERQFIPRGVAYDFIKKHPAKVILDLDLASFAELIDIQPTSGEFIHSMSEPFSDEDIETNVMKNWLEHFNLNFHQLHASGHAQERDLKEIVSQVRPKILLPIHTEHAHLFEDIAKGVDVRTLELASTIEL